jgi:glycosyltransferase involved in cell wall biosynthesis
MKPKVTIGVCVRNCESYIKEAIDSILNQDFPHELMETIFVDDDSEDNTLSIIREYTSQIDIPTKVFHTPWKGLGHARNMVIAHAQGDFILWVDGDMVLSKDFVRKLVEFMQQHPEVGIAKGRQALEPGGNLLATLEAYSRAAGRMVDYQSAKGRLKALGTGGSIYRIEVVKQVGGFDENLRGYNEDWDIEIRVKAAGWLLSTVDVDFLDYERHGLTWSNLWGRYWLRGYYTHYFLHKNRGMLKHYRMFPLAAFLSGLLYAFTLFRLTGRKAVFLVPFQSAFKMTAWYIGFMRSHLNSYAPSPTVPYRGI